MNNNIKHRSRPGAASTAEATRSSPSPGPINDYHPVYSSPNSGYLDGNAVHRMVLSSSPYQHRASHLSLYHSQPSSDPYVDRVLQEYNPHFFQFHSHLNSGLIHKTSGPTAVFNGSSAFRRINPHENNYPFHHLQRHRSILERERGFESIYHKGVNLDIERERMNKERISPQKSDRDTSEYQNGENSACGSPHSTHSNEGIDNGPRFEGVVKVKKEQADGSDYCGRQSEEALKERPKRKLSAGQTPCCPICGLTIRQGEMESHFAWEMERVCEDTRKNRRSQREAAVQARKIVQSKSVNKRVKQEGQIDIPNDDTPASTRHQTYLRVCANRMARTGRSSKSTRSRSAQSSPVNPAVYHDSTDEGTSGVKSATCPVCESVIHGSGEELNAHVEACLRKRGQTTEEVNGQASFDEYEWAGQTRIRATALLEGGFRASGFQTGVKRKVADEDDGDLNIDGDDTEEFGKAQYSESDIIPCSADEPGENRARQALRGAVLSCENSPASRNTNTPPRTRWSDDEREAAQTEEKAEDKEAKDKHSNDSSDPGLVINSLKTKVKDLEKQTVAEKVKCLICMEPYTIPLVSISCWHVHCEECWLRTLGAKKLCPQCNMITSPNDLRRIYL